MSQLNSVEVRAESLEELAERRRTMLATKLSADLVFALADQVEELNTMASEFRLGIGRLVKRMLDVMDRSDERCLIFPLAVPGFTALMFKKRKPNTDTLIETYKAEGLELFTKKMAENEKQSEGMVATLILKKYLEYRKNNVMLIDASNCVLVLLPLDDARKSLKEFGLYLI